VSGVRNVTVSFSMPFHVRTTASSTATVDATPLSPATGSTFVTRPSNTAAAAWNASACDCGGHAQASARTAPDEPSAAANNTTARMRENMARVDSPCVRVT
jgi:hypothetical protein